MRTIVATTGTGIHGKFVRFLETKKDQPVAKLRLKDGLVRGWPDAEDAAIEYLERPATKPFIDEFLMGRDTKRWAWQRDPVASALNLLRRRLQESGEDADGLHVVLVHGANPASDRAAHLLATGLCKTWQEESVDIDVDCCGVQGIDPTMAALESEGFANLCELLARLLTNGPDPAPIVLAVGGFKVLSTVATLMALVAGTDV
ncbi:MAG: hypothetical protein IT198_17250, partial [Acidimicrobiia bacterium]|nr:hypothetical protein [Acidimicrobiia bacterium]